MSVQETILIAQQWIEYAWNRGNVSLIDEMHSENYVHHDLCSEPPGEKDINYIKQWITDLRRAIPDIYVTVDDFVTEANNIAVRWTSRGTHRRELFGFAATEKKIIWHGISILIIEKKKISDTWILDNLHYLLSQLREGSG